MSTISALSICILQDMNNEIRNLNSNWPVNSRLIRIAWFNVMLCVSVSWSNCDDISKLSPPLNLVNAASVHQGGMALAWFSQETFDAIFAIDEIVSNTQKG